MDTQNDLSTSSGTRDAVVALAGGVLVYSVITEHLITTGIDSLWSVLFAFIHQTLYRAALSTVFPLYLVLVGWMGLLSSQSS